MAGPAHVSSIEAIEDFRAALIIYLEKSLRAADDSLDDVSRTRTWLDQEQRRHWESQIHRRTKLLEMAQEELFSARTANLGETVTMKQLAVNRAKRSVDEATAKLDRLKLWSRRFDNEVRPEAKQIEKLRGMLTSEMRKALQQLTESVKALDAYSDRSPISSVAPEVRPAEAPAPAKEATP